MARKKASDEHITFKEKENERIYRIIQCDFFGITDNVPDDTTSSTREQTRKKIAKNTPFWTAVIAILLSLIGTTVAIALLVLDEGQHAGYGIGTGFAISATVLASIFLWHMWNDRRKRRRLFKRQTEPEFAELRLHYQHSRSNYPGTFLSHTKYSPCSDGSPTPTVVPKRRSKVVGEGFEIQGMRRALRGSYRPKSPHPQRPDFQSRQDIMVANHFLQHLGPLRKNGISTTTSSDNIIRTRSSCSNHLCSPRALSNIRYRTIRVFQFPNVSVSSVTVQRLLQLQP